MERWRRKLRVDGPFGGVAMNNLRVWPEGGKFDRDRAQGQQATHFASQPLAHGDDQRRLGELGQPPRIISGAPHNRRMRVSRPKSETTFSTRRARRPWAGVNPGPHSFAFFRYSTFKRNQTHTDAFTYTSQKEARGEKHRSLRVSG